MPDSDSNRCLSPVFIVGAPRSGTTLLASILGRHTNLFIQGEVHFFDDIYAIRKLLGRPSDPQAFETIFKRLMTHYRRFNFFEDQQRIERIFAAASIKKRMQAECVSYPQVFSFFMNIQAAELDKPRWGNQVPRDLFNIPTIIDFYPDAKIIICVRDIRDFLHSYKFKWRNTSPENVARIKAMYHPVVTSFLWKMSMRKIADIEHRVPKGNFTIVRYEDLVRDPEGTVRQVCTKIDEAFEPAMLDIDSDNSSFGGQKGVFKTSVGRWQKALSNEEAVLAQWIGGRQMNALKYAIEPISFRPIKLIRVLISTPIAFTRAIKAGKNVRGPLIPYLIKRLPMITRKN